MGKGMATSDLGLPVAFRALREGVPVYDRGGEHIGVVEDVLVDEVADIFEGLVIHTHPLPGRHLYAAPEQIGEMYERGVRLSVDREALYEPGEHSGRHSRAGDASLGARLEAALRHAWDRMTGAAR
jgi:hypothetical protein